MTDNNSNYLKLNSSISFDESKIKSLEARMIGPSKDGLLPISSCIDHLDLENLKSKLSNISEQNSIVDPGLTVISNTSVIKNSKRKGGNPEKAELCSKIVNNQNIIFLSTKRHQSINYTNNSKKDKQQSHCYSPDSVSDEDSSQSSKSDKSKKDKKLKEEEMISSKYISSDYFSKKKTSNVNNQSGSKNNNINVNTNLSTNSNNQTQGLQGNSKINSYFRQSSSSQVINGGNALINQNIIEPKSSLSISLEEINKFKLDVEALKKQITEKDIELQQYKFKINEYEHNYKNILNELDLVSDAKERTTDSLVVYLRELEEMKRNKQKEWVNNQGFKIGKLKTYSHLGNNQLWEDGVEVKFAKQELDKINREKEEEKKAKRKIAANNYDKLEEAKFKLEKLNRTEGEIKERLVKYFKERIILEAEDKRLLEENKCAYMKKNWPILNKRYLILSLIGKGGYSEVYKAYDLIQHINVACKIHQLDTSWSEGVKELYIRHTIRENQIHQKINHEKVVKHFDTVEIDNNSFATVLELCSGPDLSYYLKQNGHLTEREARIIIKQIIIGLKELHRQGVIHYDLKPQNIIFHKGEVKISDFGLAKDMADKDKIEITCMGVGTYYYLPPETFDPNRNSLIDQKVDIWSVGVIFYELLYGMKPFGNNMSQENILKNNLIWSSKPVEFPTESKITVSKETQDYIRRCLSKDVNMRYSVFQAYDALNDLAKVTK